MTKHNVNIGRRGPMEIIYNILYHINDNGPKGISKTHIMYSSNLNWKQLEDYLNHLIVRGLIKKDGPDGNIKYFLTEKGYEVLHRFNNLFILLSINNNDLD